MSKAHHLHRKASIHKYVLRNRRIWRLYWRLDRLFVLANSGMKPEKKEFGPICNVQLR